MPLNTRISATNPYQPSQATFLHLRSHMNLIGASSEVKKPHRHPRLKAEQLEWVQQVVGVGKAVVEAMEDLATGIIMVE